MIHIKETEIIPFLKTAQTGYTKMINEGDLEMEVELAEKVEEAIEAEETILQLFFDAYERAMKYTKGNINLSLRMAAMLVSAMVHDQTESKSFQFLWQMGRDNK